MMAQVPMPLAGVTQGKLRYSPTEDWPDCYIQGRASAAPCSSSTRTGYGPVPPPAFGGSSVNMPLPLESTCNYSAIMQRKRTCELSRSGFWQTFPANTERRCEHSQSNQAPYWVLSHLPLCYPKLQLRVALGTIIIKRRRGRHCSEGRVPITSPGFPWNWPPGNRGFLGCPARSRFGPADAQGFL